MRTERKRGFPMTRTGRGLLGLQSVTRLHVEGGEASEERQTSSPYSTNVTPKFESATFLMNNNNLEHISTYIHRILMHMQDLQCVLLRKR